ncbi:MAG: molybdate transport system substrate-binding protein [Cognaticolwellia sp.]|jgi:molybdate transport system substrate-binding protein
MLLLAALACTLSCMGASNEEPVRVYAAASLGPALTPILEAWSQDSGHPTALSTASTPRIVSQLQSGAPADLVLTADTLWMQFLVDGGLVQSPVHLLSNTLVLVVAAGSPVQTLTDLQGPIALAGEQVPAGRYAEQALRAEGLWANLSPQARRGDNVRTVLAWVSRGEVSAAVVYGSDAHNNPKVRVLHRFPEHAHEPIAIWAATTPQAQAPAQGLLSVLAEPPGQARFIAAGFTGVGSVRTEADAP